jgi:hypothetical protein
MLPEVLPGGGLFWLHKASVARYYLSLVAKQAIQISKHEVHRKDDYSFLEASRLGEY